MLSEVSNSICFMVFGSCFPELFGFHSFKRLVPTSTLGLRKYRSDILLIEYRIIEESDLGRAMSDFLLIIFLSDNSTVVLGVLIIFWLNYL